MSSVIELNLNWHWVEVIGRDEHNHRRVYDRTMQQLTKEFDICPSFLVDREHTLVQPQILQSPNHLEQYLICIRVATPKISTTDDSIVELTNRWLIFVDLNRKLVVTLHRLDCPSMANLRMHWTDIMTKYDISFEEFLSKLFDDAVDTFSVSLDAHASLLDICEAKLLLTSSKFKKPVEGRDSVHQVLNIETLRQVQAHFDESDAQSEFLEQLLDSSLRRIDKTEMNSFLYHLLRRSAVHSRILGTTQLVLARTFTTLRLCSRQHSNQMCSHCIELGAKAQEIRDGAQNLLDMHISLQSFRTNELMAILTRVSILFTPCAFFASVYGMNFPMIPELHWPMGYAYFWLLCLVVTLAVQLFFHHRGLF